MPSGLPESGISPCSALLSLSLLRLLPHLDSRGVTDASASNRRRRLQPPQSRRGCPGRARTTPHCPDLSSISTPMTHPLIPPFVPTTTSRGLSCTTPANRAASKHKPISSSPIPTINQQSPTINSSQHPINSHTIQG